MPPTSPSNSIPIWYILLLLCYRHGQMHQFSIWISLCSLKASISDNPSENEGRNDLESYLEKPSPFSVQENLPMCVTECVFGHVEMLPRNQLYCTGSLNPPARCLLPSLPYCTCPCSMGGGLIFCTREVGGKKNKQKKTTTHLGANSSTGRDWRGWTTSKASR